MSLFFNDLPPNLTRTLEDHATRQRRTVEQVAIDALERGLAFSDDAEQDMLWAENPQFDEALRNFAEMDRE